MVRRMSEDFEVLAEWTIRKLRDIDLDRADREKIIRWVLYSLGVKDLGIDIYLYLKKVKRSTTTEIAEKFNISPTTARKYLEQLHSLGLVDYIGREYHLTREDLSGCIREILLPRIRRVLEDIADIAGGVEFGEWSEERAGVIRYTTSELRRAIDKAKEDVMRSINELAEKGVKITPEVISKILSKTFNAIGETINRIGEYIEEYGKNIEKMSHGFFFIWPPRHPKSPKIEIAKPRGFESGFKFETGGITRGKSIVETRDKIIYRIYSEHKLTKGDFEYARKVGKKIKAYIFGYLEIDEDVSPEYADVVESIKVYGYAEGPKEFLKALGDKLRVFGHIEYI